MSVSIEDQLKQLTTMMLGLQEQISTMKKEKQEPLDSSSSSSSSIISRPVSTFGQLPMGDSTVASNKVYYKPKLITAITLPILGSTISAAEFSSFKFKVENELQIHDLSMYIEKDHSEIVKYIHSIYGSADAMVVSKHVTTQSITLAGLLNNSFPCQCKSIRDKLILMFNDNSQINNVYFMWKVILEMFENKSGTHVSGLLSEALAIKHQSHINPMITIERFKEIHRQLKIVDAELPEWLFYTLISNSLPSDMSTIQQELSKPGKHLIEDAYIRLKSYWDCKPKDYNTNQSNNNLDGGIATEKALSLRSSGICFYYTNYGNCKNGKKCSFKHIDHHNTHILNKNYDESNNHNNNDESDDDNDNSSESDHENDQSDQDYDNSNSHSSSSSSSSSSSNGNSNSHSSSNIDNSNRHSSNGNSNRLNNSNNSSNNSNNSSNNNSSNNKKNINRRKVSFRQLSSATEDSDQ